MESPRLRTELATPSNPQAVKPTFRSEVRSESPKAHSEVAGKAGFGETVGALGGKTARIAFTVADKAKVGEVVLPSGATFDAHGRPM